MITINFQTRCRETEHCKNLEDIKDKLKNGDYSAAELKQMFKQELAGCCGNCDKNSEYDSLTKKLFEV